MHKRSSWSRDAEDENQIAFRTLAEITKGNGESLPGRDEKEPPAGKPKNPAAVELGRLGGLKGGKARAVKLSSKRRKEIASQAAKTRWKKRNSAPK